VTACRAALELAGIRISALSPRELWNALVRRFSPGYRLLSSDGKSFDPPIPAQPGYDAGSPRLGDPFALQRLLFDLLFRQSQPDVHSTLHPCTTDDPNCHP
jgi:hypothetical protein